MILPTHDYAYVYIQMGDPQYGSVEYWNERYSKDSSSFEWHQPWSTVKTAIKGSVIYSGTAVNVGCGTSTMSTDLLRDGFMRVNSVDFSSVLIDKLKEKHSAETRIQWICSDCTEMSFKDSSVNAVFDKGTLDSIASDEDATEKITKYLKLVEKMLVVNGVYVLVSFAPLQARQRYFKAFGNNLLLTKTAQIPKFGLENAFHYVYVFRKVIPELLDEEEDSDK